MSSREEGQHRQTQLCGEVLRAWGWGRAGCGGWERRLGDPQTLGSRLAVTVVLIRMQPQPLAAGALHRCP